MPGSNFPFIDNEVLRRNLDDAFGHIVTLIPFSQSASKADLENAFSVASDVKSFVKAKMSQRNS